MTTNNGVVSSPVNEFTLECHTEQYSELLSFSHEHTHTKGKEKNKKTNHQQQQKQRFTLIFHWLAALNVLLGKPHHNISFLHELYHAETSKTSFFKMPRELNSKKNEGSKQRNFIYYTQNTFLMVIVREL